MSDTWHTRDLPILKAVVEIYDRTGRNGSATELETACGFDADTVQQALRALCREPFFDEGANTWSGKILGVGPPTSAALRVAGQWPSPEVQLERLIAAFEAVAADESQPEDERSRAEKVGRWLTGALSQVAINALGGAGGKLITG